MDYLMFFLPLVVLIYSILGNKQKKYFLLIAGYLFFALISGKLVIYLFLTTLTMFFLGQWLHRLHVEEKDVLSTVEKEHKKAIKAKYLNCRRSVMGLGAVLHIGLLLVLKYSGFFMENVNTVLAILKVPVQFAIPHFLMPIGISFFTMQAVSYLFDVYRGTIKAEKNIFKLALFISFFPQIVEGPICRYEQTAEQLWNVGKIEHKNLVFGLQRILFGMMKKIVIADRLNPLIKEVFTNFLNYDGGIVAIAAVCYTIQLYMEFSGTMDAVIGSAQIFGVKLPENFARPFFSKTISDFWARWHISLGGWFKDYIFYPVTLSKPVKKLTGTIKKKTGNYVALLVASAIALFCVWFCNGLWHGAAWNYVFFGMYHFGLIMMGNMIEPLVKCLKKALHVNTNHVTYQLFQMIRTSILVVIGELFFRCHGLKSGLIMFKMMLTDFSIAGFNLQSMKALGIDGQDICIVGIALLVVLATSVLKERGMELRETLAKCPVVVRWAVLYGLILFVVIFGAYGLGYIPVDPIYANF
ncbi:MAG: MBOAT family protein [Roseburia sp.]|nr:MBOAT family protein [Roseburia sp.]